jgi:hypothetical protein
MPKESKLKEHHRQRDEGDDRRRPDDLPVKTVANRNRQGGNPLPERR